mmetsp:Transcript_37808/g.89461  ORF Transcript_37808/g.89461 Transcript_37808/m.89461 type:complete len:321 (-) Transcript_37808:102-1064(-)
MKEYLALSLSSKFFYDQLRFQTDMQNEQLLYISGNVNQIFFRQTGVTFFGSEEWENTFGIRILEDSVSLLSMDAFSTLHAPCPFTPGKLVKDTHALVYVPDRIPTERGEEEAVSFPVLGRLCPSILQDPDPAVWGGDLQEALLAWEQPEGAIIPDTQPGVPGYRFLMSRLEFIDCGKGIDLTVPRKSWILFYVGDDHGLVPESRGEAFWQNVRRLQGVNQEFVDPDNRLGRNGELRAGTGYEIMGALEIAIIAALIYSKTRQRILPSEPKTFAVTKYIAMGHNRTIIGDSNDATGLFGFYSVGDDDELGVCAARRLDPPA